MTIRAKIISICTATVLTGGLASAQDTANQSTNAVAIPDDTNSAAVTETAPAPPPPPLRPAPVMNPSWQKALTQEFSRAGGLVGKEAQGSRGESLGTIKDVAFNQQGQVFALIDIGDGRLVPVPWKLANVASTKGRTPVGFSVSGEAIRQAPVVTADQWGELDNPNLTDGILAYYRDQAAAASGAASSPTGTDQGQSSNSQPAAAGDSQP